MNIKNKLLTTALTASMLVPMASTSVFAADVSGEATKTSNNLTTNVTYNVTAGYTWSIHSDIDFGENAGVDNTVEKTIDISSNTNTVSVSKNVIPDGQKLQITVKGNGGNEIGNDTSFKIANGNTKLEYAVKAGETSITTGGAVLDVKAGTNTGSANLTFTLNTKNNGTAEVAGKYTGKVIYTASVE